MINFSFWGALCPGAVCHWGGLSVGDLSGAICPGALCPGAICPEPVLLRLTFRLGDVTKFVGITASGTHLVTRTSAAVAAGVTVRHPSCNEIKKT